MFGAIFAKMSEVLTVVFAFVHFTFFRTFTPSRHKRYLESPVLNELPFFLIKNCIKATFHRHICNKVDMHFFITHLYPDKSYE